MTDTATSPAASVPAETPKKGKGKAAKKGSTPKAASTKGKAKVATHPPTAQMVNAAITSLNEKGGSSLHAIKKYISANYKLDAAKANIFILKYLRSAVAAGKLVQTKGTGANGSFKFPGKDKPAQKKSPKKTTKKAAPKKEKKEARAKKTSPKKKPAPKKAPAKAKSPAKPKPKKLKATAKPKKATPAKKPAAKQAERRHHLRRNKFVSS